MVKSAIVAVLLASLSFASYASDSEICNSCSTIAMQYQARDKGNGDHYFFDMVRRKLTHLRVTGITSPMLVPGHYRAAPALNGTVTEVNITSAEQGLFGKVQHLYDINGSLLTITSASVDIPLDSVISASRLNTMANYASTSEQSSEPSGQKVTAFDFVATPVVRDAAISEVTNFGNDPFGTFTTVIRVALSDIESFASIALINTPVTVREKLNFPDGSSVELHWSFADQRFHPTPGSAKDAVGNPIPETAAAAAGYPTHSSQTYVFPDSPDGMMAGLAEVDNLNRLGVGVRVPSVPIRGAYTIACVTVAGGSTHCELTLNGM